MFALILVLPFILSGILAMVLRNDKLSGPIALGAGIVTIARIAILYFNNPGVQSVNWFSVGPYTFTLIASAGPMHLIFLALISFMSTMVILYSLGFMNVRSERNLYYMMISFFAAGMMLFAVGADLITLFIGWELIGLASYLLIGFWRYKESAIKAANKAVIVLFIGDVLVFAGIALLWSQLHSVSLSYIEANATGAIASISALLIVAGALTKSAQFPFHEWLTAAMEGPTPVSALLHSSTMVKAGAFLIAIMLPFILGAGLGPILIGAGIASVVIASINALSTTHIKKVLAYSTIEDMGLIFIALGFNAIWAAVLLFVFQTFYKGLIFMNAGILTKSNKDETDIRKISTSKRLGIILPLIIGVAAVAGVFPLGGFFGKIAVVSAVQNYAVYAVLLVVEIISSMYIFRWLFVPLANSKSKKKSKSDYAVPNSMLAAVYILSFMVLATSIAWIYLSGILHGPMITYQAAAIFTVLLAIGLVLSYLLYYRKLASNAKLRNSLSRISDIGIAINAVYKLVILIVNGIGAAVDLFDYNLYSGLKGTGYGLGRISVLLEKTENGSINYYLGAFVVAAIIAIIVFSVI